MEVTSTSDNNVGSSVDVESIEARSINTDDDSPATHNNDTKPQAVQTLEKRRRIGLFVFSAITGALYAGAFFSWGPMQLLLEAHGVFEDRCKEGEATPCAAQTTRLLTVQFVAQFAIVLSPVLGVIADHYGPLMLMYVTSASGCLGLGLLTLATGIHVDNLVFVAFFLIGTMAMASAVNTVQVGMLFDPITRQRVISALNTLFDAGLLTYLALWGIKGLTGCSLPALLGGYLVIGALCFGGSIHYWRVAVPVDTCTCDSEEDAVGALSSEPSTETTRNEDEGEAPGFSDVAENGRDNDMMELGQSDIQSGGDDDLVATNSPASDTVVSSDDDYVLIADRPPMQQLRSRQFVTLTIFFAIHATRDMFNLTSARDFLAYLGDDETGHKYLTIYTLLTPASILGLPALDFVLRRYGYHAGLQTVNALALGQGIIMVSSENLNVQVLGFIFASFFRCFMYTISLGILPTFMGVNAVGKASGILPCAAGVLALVNIPLANWAVNGLDGNFFYPNLIYTIAVVPCIFLAWMLGQGIKREDAAKTQLSKTK